MCPQPFREYGNIVPHGRASAWAQFVEIRSISTTPPGTEGVQGNAKPLGHSFLVNKLREVHLYFFRDVRSVMESI